MGLHRWHLLMPYFVMVRLPAEFTGGQLCWRGDIVWEDGADRFTVFYKVILPLAAPALVITALFSFLTAWSEYIVAAQVLLTEELFTVPLGLKQFQSSMTTEWGLYSAGSIIVSIPVVALFMYLSRWLVSGLTLGSVKG